MSAARWSYGRFPPSASTIALIILFLAALALRLYGLNWDDGRDLHPDELYVAKIVLIDRIFFSWPPDLQNLLDPAQSGLNPRSADPATGELRDYPYGALPLLVTDAVATILGWITGMAWTAADRAYLVGRALSALLDTLTVLVVFAVGDRAFGRRVGLYAAVFAALAPMSIQLAHFFTTDSWLTFFVSLSLYSAIRAAEYGSGRWFAATGFALGLAMATKGSVFALAGLVGAAILYDVMRRWRSGASVSVALREVPKQVAISAIAAVVGFGLFEPYALVSPGIYLFSLQRQAEIVSGAFDVPFTRHYIGTIPVVYQLEQFVRWGFGPVAGLLALVGIAVLARQFWQTWRPAQWLVLAWILGYGVVIAVPETKFLRYLAPLVPALALAAGLALDALDSLIRRKVGPQLAIAALAVLLAGSGLWTIAFESVYAVEHPRLAASRWIFANVPPGSVLSWEYWDDRLPKPIGPGLSEEEHQYEFVTVDLFADRPPAEAADALFETLEQIDYLVTSSDRIANAIPRSPWRYPVQNRFLSLVAGEQLGFEKVAEFHVSPRLGPIVFDDREADESFVNYDHPRVTIYAKAALIERVDYDHLMAWALDRPWSPARHPERPSLLLDEPVGSLPVVADTRWSAGLTGNSLAAMAVWLVFLVVLQVVGWPIVSLLFPRLADAGWGLARLVALLLAGYAVWLGASTRLVEFRATWAATALVAVGALGWLAKNRWGGTLLRSQWRVIRGAELTFWFVFLVFLLFRYLNPDSWHPIWGGEKPMEFAHLNATLRSAYFPPYDPWFADGYINYYYFGLYLVAFTLKLTGIPSEIGFNLAQPTVIALLASTAFSVAATLGRDLTRLPRLGIPSGILGTLMVLFIGNLTTLGQLLSFEWPPFDSFDDWTWRGSRAIVTAITEFPYFTALYADLHAHVVALPVTILAIALSYAVARDGQLLFASAASVTRRGAWRIFGARLVLLMLVIGLLLPINAWDVPVYAALAIAALWMCSAALSDWRWRIAGVGSAALLLGMGAYATIRPFQDHYVALFSSLELVREPTPFTEAASHVGGLLAIALLGLALIALPRDAPSIWPLNMPGLVVATLVLLIMAGNTVALVQPVYATAIIAVSLVAVASLVLLISWVRIASAVVNVWQRWLLLGAAALAVAAILLALARGQMVLAGYLIVAGLALLNWVLGTTTAVRFVSLMVLAASLVGAGAELFLVADDLLATTAYRMNTIFKFYNQIWILLAVSGAALVTRMALDSRWFGRSRSHAERRSGESLRQGWARAGLVVAAIVIAGSLTYPVFATLPRLQQRFEPNLGSGTLNALDWMDTGQVPSFGPDGLRQISFADDRAAINWLNENVAGSPVIAEASIGPYRCNGSRVSIATGLPTIIGWERHQQQQRYPDALGARVEDVRTLYTSPDPTGKEEILRKYNVEYVVVGDLERIYPVASNDCQPTGSAAGIAVFDDMIGSTLSVAFAHGGTTIYRVLPVTPS